MPSVYVGAYEMAFAGTQAAPWSGTDARCFGRTTEKTFKLSGGMLQSCNCGDGACTTIAMLPALESGWISQLIMNADRRTVMVTHAWARNARPLTSPDMLCYSASGQLLATFPQGAAELDATGQIVLLRAGSSSPNAGQTAIVDLASGQTHWLGNVAAAIAHE
jgi:hypothetical protein